MSPPPYSLHIFISRFTAVIVNGDRRRAAIIHRLLLFLFLLLFLSVGLFGLVFLGLLFFDQFVGAGLDGGAIRVRAVTVWNGNNDSDVTDDQERKYRPGGRIV